MKHCNPPNWIPVSGQSRSAPVRPVAETLHGTLLMVANTGVAGRRMSKLVVHGPHLVRLLGKLSQMPHAS
jgi:hypothetical protein